VWEIALCDGYCGLASFNRRMRDIVHVCPRMSRTCRCALVRVIRRDRVLGSDGIGEWSRLGGPDWPGVRIRCVVHLGVPAEVWAGVSHVGRRDVTSTFWVRE
jgi:hypothetical protein